MRERFHVYVRRYHNSGLVMSVLTHPSYTVVGTEINLLRAELERALAQALATDALVVSQPVFYEDMERRTIELELRAVQHDRLIVVPMRFLVLHRPLDDTKERFEVLIPRLDKRFVIQGEEHIVPWCEEIIRGFFHLETVDKLVRYQHARNERIDTLEVTYHGAGRYKHLLTKRSRLETFRQDHSPDHLNSALARVGVCLTEEAREQLLPKVHHRDALVDDLIATLTQRQSPSALLIGHAGVGKSALVNALAYRIINAQVPASLEDTPIWHVTGGRIIAGMRFLGQWQQRCLQIVQQIRGERGILFVDSLLELITAGSVQTGMNVAQFFLPYIQSGELRVIAETTPDALLTVERLNPSIIQALRHIPVPPLGPDHAFHVLELSASKLNKMHGVTLGEAAITRTLDMLARFGDAEALPGAGLSLLETVARRGLRGQTLQASDATAAFARSSGFPEALIDPDQVLQLEGVETFFKTRIIGQDRAVGLLTQLIAVIKAGLNDPERPLGTFLFAGPTGVGKTEAALSLAEYLFGDRARMVRLDMSEYGHPGSAGRLVGDAVGEGDLTRPIREQPFTVILLDEIEKAHGEVFDVLLQVLGEGRLTDGLGQTVRFRHCILIMTSNLGASVQKPPRLGPAPDVDAGHEYIDAIERFFRPEFVNRIDFLVPFDALSRDTVRAIAERMLERALRREGFTRRGIKVRFDPHVLDLLMAHGFDPRYGARPMKRAIDRHVLVPLSRLLVQRSATDVRTETLDLYVHQGRVAAVSSQSLSGVPAPMLPAFAIEHDELFQRHLRMVRHRLSQWRSSWLIRSVRAQDQELAVHQEARFDDLLSRLEQAEVSSQQQPSRLNEDTRAALLVEVQRIDQAVRLLEWDLCMVALGDTPSTLTLQLESHAADSIALDLAQCLADQLRDWALGRHLDVRIERSVGPILVHIQGAGAQTWLAFETGIHRIQRDDESVIDILVTRPDHDVETRDIVRHYTASPKSVWDPVTGATAHAELETLAQHLEIFILARMCREVDVTSPS